MLPVKGYETQYTIDKTGRVFSRKKGRHLKHSLNENGYLYISLWKDNRAQSCTVHRLVAEHFIPNPDTKPFVNHIDANRANPCVENLEWCTQSENIRHAYRLGNLSQKTLFDLAELDWLLMQVLAGKSMTELATTMKVGLSRLTINLRNHAIKTCQHGPFAEKLARQKTERNTQANAVLRKPIQQFTLGGEFLAEYPSATAATRALGKTSNGSISNAANPTFNQTTAYGYLWKLK